MGKIWPKMGKKEVKWAKMGKIDKKIGKN